MQQLIQLFLLLLGIVSDILLGANKVMDALTLMEAQLREAMADAISKVSAEVNSFFNTKLDAINAQIVDALSLSRSAHERLSVLESTNYGDVEDALPLYLDGSPLDLYTAFVLAIGNGTSQPNAKYVLFVSGKSSELTYTNTQNGVEETMVVDAGEKIIVVTDGDGNASTATVISDTNAERIAAAESRLDTITQQVAAQGVLSAGQYENLMNEIGGLRARTDEFLQRINSQE